MDSSTKYGLCWKKDIYRQIKKGDQAGYLRPGRKNEKGYAAVRLQGNVYYIHRILYYLYTHIDPKDNFIDHIDGNTLNNSIDNLRLVSNKQNQQNRATKNKNNSSGYKGVTWDKNRNKWIAQITVEGKCKFLGRYDCKIKAALAYNRAAIKYFKEYAALNKV